MDEIEKLVLKIKTLQQDYDKEIIHEKRIRSLFLQLAKELSEKTEEVRVIKASLDIAQKHY
jgi:di/tripeptidase